MCCVLWVPRYISIVFFLKPGPRFLVLEVAAGDLQLVVPASDSSCLPQHHSDYRIFAVFLALSVLIPNHLRTCLYTSIPSLTIQSENALVPDLISVALFLPQDPTFLRAQIPNLRFDCLLQGNHFVNPKIPFALFPAVLTMSRCLVARWWCLPEPPGSTKLDILLCTYPTNKLSLFCQTILKRFNQNRVRCQFLFLIIILINNFLHVC